MSENMSQDRFYVYKIRRPEDSVFYVGKSKDPEYRLDYHIRQALKGERSHKANVLRKIIREGGWPRMEVVFESDCEDEAFAEEIRLIAHYRNEGVLLTNVMPGGQGTSLTELHKAKLRVALKGRKRGPLSAECKAKISAAGKGRRHTAESKAKMSAAAKGRPGWNKGKPWPPEVRARISAGNKGHGLGQKRGPLSPETRAKISASIRATKKGRPNPNKGKPLSAEHRARISVANKGRPVPETRKAKISASVRASFKDRPGTFTGRKHTDETKAKLRATKALKSEIRDAVEAALGVSERKWCPACNRTHPRAEFYNDRSRRDGLCYICRGCFRARMRERTQSQVE